MYIFTGAHRICFRELDFGSDSASSGRVKVNQDFPQATAPVYNG